MKEYQQLLALPLELQTSLIKNYLNLNDKLNLRLVNKSFKSLVDNQNGFLDKLKVKLNIDSTNVGDLIDSLKFVLKVKKINRIELDCPTHVKSLFEAPGNQVDFSLRLSIPRINIKSLDIINGYSDVCEQLKIKRIVRYLDSVSMDTIVDKLSINETTSLKLNRINHLRIEFYFDIVYKNKRFENLVMNCLGHDFLVHHSHYEVDTIEEIESLGDTPTQFFMNFEKYYKIFKEKKLQNNESICGGLLNAINFNKETLKTVEFRDYSGPLKIFLNFLSNVQLNCLILEKFNPIFEDEAEYECKIDTKQIVLYCTAKIMNHLIKNYINFNGLESIDIANYLHPIRVKNYSYYITEIFSIINEKARDLRKIFISVADYYEGMKKSNFLFSSSIEEIKFGVLIDIKDALELVNQMKFKNDQSENFRVFKSKILVDCNKHEDINKLKEIVVTLSNRFQSLESILINLMCCHFNIEKCPLVLMYKLTTNRVKYALSDFEENEKNSNRNLQIFIKKI